MRCFLPVLGVGDGVYDGVVDGRRLGDHGRNRVHVRRQHVGVPGGGREAGHDLSHFEDRVIFKKHHKPCI